MNVKKQILDYIKFGKIYLEEHYIKMGMNEKRKEFLNKLDALNEDTDQSYLKVMAETVLVQVDRLSEFEQKTTDEEKDVKILYCSDTKKYYEQKEEPEEDEYSNTREQYTKEFNSLLNKFDGIER